MKNNTLPQAEQNLLLIGQRVLGGPASPSSTNAVAIEAGRIADCGPESHLRQRFPGLAVRDVRPAVLAPAFCDHHLHLGELVRRASAVSLSPCQTFGDLADCLKSKLVQSDSERQDTLLAFDLNLHNFQGWPSSPREALSAICPQRPLVVRSLDLHTLFANRAALLLAGQQERGDGQLREQAAWDFMAQLPLPQGPAWDRALDQVIAQLHRVGIVRVTDMSGLKVHQRLCSSPSTIELALKVTTSLLLEELGELKPEHLRPGQRQGKVSMGFLKAFADGSLGSDTAWMLSDPDSRMSLHTDEELRAIRATGREKGLPLALHAIGDGAVRQAAGILGPGDRLEHCQHLHSEDLARLKAAGLTVCANPGHMELDWQTASRHLPEGGRGSYALGSLARQGIGLRFGSDAPVSPAQPLSAARWAVSRTTAQGQPAGGWLPQECLSRAQALAGWWAQPDPLVQGRAADLLALDKDPFQTSLSQWDEISLRGLWLDGREIKI